MKSDLIDIECEVVEEREKAVAIWDGVSYGEDYVDPDTGEVRKNRKWTWLPRSQIEIIPNGKTATVTLPEWLATEKGLI